MSVSPAPETSVTVACGRRNIQLTSGMKQTHPALGSSQNEKIQTELHAELRSKGMEVRPGHGAIAGGLLEFEQVWS